MNRIRSLITTQFIRPIRFYTTMSVNPTSLSSFNENHQLYDQVRPDFRPEAVEQLCKDLGLKKNSKVLELASGTGKFTKAIADKGFQLTAAEPSSGMNETFKKNFPNIPVVEAGSYDLPFEDSSVDAIIIAQAFHWFADSKSVQELGRVLAPGGKLGLIWNYEAVHDDNPETDWQRASSEVIWRYSHSVPQYQQMKWPRAFENQSIFKLPMLERHFPWEKKYNRDQVWPYWESRSYITALSSEERKSVREEMEAVLDRTIKPSDYDSNGQLTVKRGVHTVVLERA